MSTEFELIEKYFHPLSKIGNSNIFAIGQGDDCAVVKPDSRPMAFSIDTQVSDIHFYADMPAKFIAARGLGAALSDLAAMGAEPAFFTLALSLPDYLDDTWIEAYANGLSEVATQWSIPLIGGDTTKSVSLIQTFQVHGYLNQPAMVRSGAKTDDIIAVTGKLGDAAAAVELTKEGSVVDSRLMSIYQHPQPRLDISPKLALWATSCIDISDGLLADLGHICEQSHCGAEISLGKIPTSEAFKDNIKSATKRIELSTAGGDDYQLCFTIPKSDWHKIESLDVTAIGTITSTSEIICFDSFGSPVKLNKSGFQHR